MEAALQQLLDAGLADSTKKVYSAGWNRYLSFTQLFQLPPVPVSTENVTLFVAFLGSQGLAVSTIKSYLAALRHARLMADPHNISPSFHSPHMAVLLRGIRRSQSLQGPRRIRLPITATLMRRIKISLASHPKAFLNVLLWAACCVGFFGFLRCGEFLVPDDTPFDPQFHLSLSDVSVVPSASQWTVFLNIKVSKTDQFRQGSVVALGSTGLDLCPVSALLDYLVVRGDGAGPLSQLEDGRPLHRRLFTQQVQQALSMAGLDGSQFNGHSFRIGAATTASGAGIPETTIKHLGRWRSAAYQSYIQTPPTELAQVSRQLATTDSQA